MTDQSGERRSVSEACECGHGQYNHLMRGLLRPLGECIRCNCERYRRRALSGEFGDLLRDAHRAVNELDRLRAENERLRAAIRGVRRVTHVPADIIAICDAVLPPEEV